MKTISQRGFTLIELSIVLVIIGLLVSGVLLGKDLIHAAELRATVRQIEEFDVAINTFQGKYNCLPGDCDHASQFGFIGSSILVYAADPNGNGDGFITNLTGAEGTRALLHLSQAGLLRKTEYGGVSNYSIVPLIISATDHSGNKGGWVISYMGTRSTDPSYSSDPELISVPAHYYWATADYGSSQKICHIFLVSH